MYVLIILYDDIVACSFVAANRTHVFIILFYFFFTRIAIIGKYISSTSLSLSLSLSFFLYVCLFIFLTWSARRRITPGQNMRTTVSHRVLCTTKRDYHHYLSTSLGPMSLWYRDDVSESASIMQIS